MKVTDQLRRAIESGDKSRYQLAKETGISASTLCRFVHGQGGLSMDGLDTLCKALGLELVQRQRKGDKK